MIEPAVGVAIAVVAILAFAVGSLTTGTRVLSVTQIDHEWHLKLSICWLKIPFIVKKFRLKENPRITIVNASNNGAVGYAILIEGVVADGGHVLLNSMVNGTKLQKIAQHHAKELSLPTDFAWFNRRQRTIACEAFASEEFGDARVELKRHRKELFVVVSPQRKTWENFSKVFAVNEFDRCRIKPSGSVLRLEFEGPLCKPDSIGFGATADAPKVIALMSKIKEDIRIVNLDHSASAGGPGPCR